MGKVGETEEITIENLDGKKVENNDVKDKEREWQAIALKKIMQSYELKRIIFYCLTPIPDVIPPRISQWFWAWAS